MAKTGQHLRIGETIAGKYDVVRVIGRGGMGVVCEGVHLRLGQRVAIKMLRGRALEVPEARARFEREARAAARLRSPHVARVTDVDALPDGTPYMVMEYLEGHDLGTELELREKLPVGEAIDIVLQICMAMTEAHSHGVIHRDLKPENVFLCMDPSAARPSARLVKVLDFGISKLLSEDEQRVTLTSSTLGTPLYMSPEQIRSAKDVDARTDIWSLGVILYEALTGVPPFLEESASAVIASITADDPVAPTQHQPSLPAELAAVIGRCLQKRPADRYASVSALGEALQPFANSVVFELPSGNWPLPPARPAQPSAPRWAEAETMPASESEPRAAIEPPIAEVAATASPVTTMRSSRRHVALLVGTSIAGLTIGGLLMAVLGGSPTAEPAATSQTPLASPPRELAQTARSLPEPSASAPAPRKEPPTVDSAEPPAAAPQAGPRPSAAASAVVPAAPPKHVPPSATVAPDGHVLTL